MQLIRQAMNKQLLPFESKNGNYEGEATQVLVSSIQLLCRQKLFDENTDEYWKYLDFKRIHPSFLNYRLSQIY